MSEMDWSFLIFLTHTFDIITAGTGKDITNIITHNETVSWMAALTFCKNNNARMISEEDIKLMPDVNIKDTWLGEYRARTKYMTDLGCYRLGVNVIVDLQSSNNEKMNAQLCFFFCTQNADFNVTFIALKGTTCLCFSGAELPSGSVFSLGCLNQCHDESVCGGKETYSIHRIEYFLEYQSGVGWCGIARSPFEQICFESCSESFHHYCTEILTKTEHNNSGSIEYIISSNSRDWQSAEATCRQKTGLGSMFSMSVMEDFKLNKTSFREDTYTYWVATRIRLLTMDPREIVVNSEYMYRCSLWEFNTTKPVGCTRNQYVMCIKNEDDVSSTKECYTAAYHVTSGHAEITEQSHGNTEKNVRNDIPNLLLGITIGASAFVSLLFVIIVILLVRKKRKGKRSGGNSENSLQNMKVSVEMNKFDETYDSIPSSEDKKGRITSRNAKEKIKDNHVASENETVDYEKPGPINDTKIKTDVVYDECPSGKSETTYDIAKPKTDNGILSIYDHTDREPQSIYNHTETYGSQKGENSGQQTGVSDYDTMSPMEGEYTCVERVPDNYNDHYTT